MYAKKHTKSVEILFTLGPKNVDTLKTMEYCLKN